MSESLPPASDSGLELARSWLARHGGAVGDDLGPVLDAGYCEECATLAGSRWRHGAFVLCLRCIVRRRRAAVAAGHELEAPAVLLEPAALCPWIGEEPPPWIGDEPPEEEGA